MDPLKPIFDKASTAILAMNQEIDDLKIKFGERSKLVTTRTDHLMAIIEMQEASVKAINEYCQALHLSEITNDALHLIITSIQTRVHTDRLLELMKPNG